MLSRFVEGPAASAKLSPREREVLELLQLGESLGDVARSLGVCKSTVEEHSKRLRQKLQVRTIEDVRRVVLQS